jgi:hypothetical protein
MIFYLSVIKLIRYEIPTGEKKNTKKKSKLKLLKNVVILVFVMEQRERSPFSLFSPNFVPKTVALPPPLVFVVCLAVVHLDWASCAAP